MVSKANADYVRFQSWGRTRQPKNLAGGHAELATDARRGAAAANQDAITNALTALNDFDAEANDGTEIPLSSRGLATENQRFLHITCPAGHTLKGLMVYSHAANVWTELKDGADIMEIAAGHCKIIEIAGVDRVAFLGGTNVILAGSTF